MSSPALIAATDRYLQILESYRPVEASSLGLHDADGRLDVMTRSAAEDEARELTSLGRALDKIDATGDDDRIDVAALHGMVRTRVCELELERQWERNPDRHLECLLDGLFTIVRRDYAPIAERVEALASRLNAGVAHLERMRDIIRDAPQVWIDGALASATAAPALLDGVVSAAIEEAGGHRGASDAADRLRRELADCAAWLEGLVGKSDWVAGEEVLSRRLASEHFIDETPSQVAERGRAIIDATSAELEALAPEVAAQLGVEFDGWRGVIDEMKRDVPEDLIGAYDTAMRRARDATIASGLADTGAPLIVEPTPEYWRHLIPFAAYSPPGPFEPDQSGFFWVTPAGADHGGGAVDLIAVHEGYPGHHLQLTTANRLDRTVRRLGWSTLLVEGWAFYCEELMWELGHYDGPVRLMQLKDQLWRGCRVVLDMGLHTGATTFDEAVDMLVDVAAIERPNAEAEVRRYTSTPTYQICYAIGKEEILAMRSASAARLGADFDLNDFHRQLLSFGSLPPPLFAGRI